MGDNLLPLFQPTFNRSVRIASSELTLTEETGSLLVREASATLGLDLLLTTLPDARDPDLIKHSMPEMVRTRVVLLVQGWGDQGDATTLRFDPALRLSVSDRAGEAPLDPGVHLASQPTLSRMQHALATDEGITAFDGILRKLSLRRIRDAEPKRPRLTIDIDTMPLETHGHQDGASYNTHYGCTCFQPLVAFAETGDILAVRLRPGANPTAEESFAFLAPVLDEAAAHGFEVCVRMDNWFANAHIMRELDKRRVRFITRLKTTTALCTPTQDWHDRVLAGWRAAPSADGQPRVATRELWDRPQKSGRVRRIIAVVVEPSPGELFGKRFFLCTNFARNEGGSLSVLEHYRKRGTAETYIGELGRETIPCLRAVPRGRPGAVTIRDNNVALLLAALAYELMHHLRRGIEKKLDEGWSLCRLRERVLRVATHVVRHARQITFRISATKAALWEAIMQAVCPAAQLSLEVAR